MNPRKTTHARAIIVGIKFVRSFQDSSVSQVILLHSFFTSSTCTFAVVSSSRNIFYKMQFTSAFITTLTAAMAASAVPQYTSVSSAPEPATSPAPCTAGSAMCCQSVTTPANATQTFGDGILNGVLGALTAPLVALGCSAIPIAGSEWSVFFP